MGLFLAMSGVAGASLADVEDCLRGYATCRDGCLDRVPAKAESWELLILAESVQGNVTVQYPGAFTDWDDASAYISRCLDVPVFSLHIHDDDLWMYVLFAGDEAVDQFNPIPDYWDDGISPEEIAIWAGDAESISKCWPGVKPDAVHDYLVRWDLDNDDPGKAYPDDRFPFNEAWQLTDFMRRLGLTYPVDDQGKIVGQTYQLRVAEEA